jgi:hypothetical protein
MGKALSSNTRTAKKKSYSVKYIQWDKNDKSQIRRK